VSSLISRRISPLAIAMARLRARFAPDSLVEVADLGWAHAHATSTVARVSSRSLIGNDDLEVVARRVCARNAARHLVSVRARVVGRDNDGQPGPQYRSFSESSHGGFARRSGKRAPLSSAPPSQSMARGHRSDRGNAVCATVFHVPL